MSNLVEFARAELEREQLFNVESELYGGLIGPAVMELVETLSKQGHSGGSHAVTLMIFNRVANWKPLSAPSNDPKEWMEVSDNLWQSLRQPSVFSTDNGNTYYDIDEQDRPIHTSQDAKV